jgi:hypothetical protein
MTTITSGDILEYARDGAGGLLHVGRVIAIDFHGDVTSDARDELVKAHLNRRRKL